MICENNKKKLFLVPLEAPLSYKGAIIVILGKKLDFKIMMFLFGR